VSKKKKDKGKKKKREVLSPAVPIDPEKAARIKAAVDEVMQHRLYKNLRGKRRHIAELRHFIDLIHRGICPLCKGKKTIKPDGRSKCIITCPLCKGTGTPSPLHPKVPKICKTCGNTRVIKAGYGNKDIRPCPDCAKNDGYNAKRFAFIGSGK